MSLENRDIMSCEESWRLFYDTMNHAETSPAAPPWQVEALRLTAFVPPDAAPAPESWWAELTGQPPERQVSRPREGQWETDGPLARPDLGAARLVLTTKRGRVEWLLVPELASEGWPVDIESAHLGPLSDALPAFSQMMRGWFLVASLDMTRLALGATLRFPVETREAAYSVISRYLPFSLPPASSDFLYRINRPRPSTSLGDDTTINRLATWAVIRVEALRIAVPRSGAGTQAVSREGEPFLACRLELDINTAADRPGTLPPDRLDALLAEFGNLAIEIAVEGDKP